MYFDQAKVKETNYKSFSTKWLFITNYQKNRTSNKITEIFNGMHQMLVDIYI